MTTEYLPTEWSPVLAEIIHIKDTGKSKWYEVVYHDGTKWSAYTGSDSFKDGETVSKWIYCTDVL